MKRLLWLLFFTFIFSISARAQTPVAITGNLATLANQPGTGRSTYLRFILKNYGAAQPFVRGTGGIVSANVCGSDPCVDFYPNSSGVVSGTLWGNDNIVPGYQNTPPTTFYQVCTYANGNLFRCQNYSITGSSWNYNTASPITSPAPPYLPFAVLINPTSNQNILQPPNTYLSINSQLVTVSNGPQTIGGCVSWVSQFQLGSIGCSGSGSPAQGNQGDLQMRGASVGTFAAAPVNYSSTTGFMTSTAHLAFKGPRPWVDVMAYGADPTGVADSTTAINNAMLAACPAASANPQYPPINCGYDIYFPSPGPPNYEYKVTQPQAPSNAPVFPYVAGGMHFIGGNAGQQTGASPSPSQSIIMDSCGASPGKGPVFQGGYIYGNNLKFENLYVSGCNEAFLMSGAFFNFKNVTATAQNQSAGGTYGQGTAPYYNAPAVFLDTLNIVWDGGAIFSNGTSYPSLVLGGDGCSPLQGSLCPNIVGLAYFSNLLMAGGSTYYLQSADINGSPPGHISFTNIDYESNLGPAFVVANISNAYTSITALTWREVVDSDQTITPGHAIDPLVLFNLTPPGGGRTNGISGVTIDRSQGSGYAVEVLNGTSLDNYVANGCQTSCDTTVMDGSGNVVGDGTITGHDGVDTTVDVSSLNHLQSSPRTVGGNQFGVGGGYRSTRSGSKFASYGVDAGNGFVFGDNTLPGWYASLGSPQNSTYPSELDLSWAATYAPTNVAATPSNTGGSLAAGAYYIYMVSTTAATCGGADTGGMSAPSAIAGPYTITGSSGSLAVTWTAPAAGPGTITGYCVFASSGAYNSGNTASALVTGTSATITSFPNAPSALPIYYNYLTTYKLFPTTAILANISLPYASSTPPWTPDCIGQGRCGSYLQPSELATDNFHRPDNISGIAPGGGGLGLVDAPVNWGPVVTTAGWAVMNIKSNVATSNQYLGIGSPGIQPYVAIDPLADQFVRTTIGNIVNGASDAVGVAARQAGGGVDTEYLFYCTNGAMLLVKRIAGMQTTLASGGPVCNNGNTIELDAVGTNLFASVNGAQVLTATDSSITSGYTGLFIWGLNDTVTSWTGGSMTLGRGNFSLFAQQNWWTGRQDFYGSVAFDALPDGCLQTTSHVVASSGVACGSGGGGGANQTLSNLTLPTALNQDLLCASAGSCKLGSSSVPMSAIFAQRLYAKGTGLSAGDFALSGGWGSTASVSNVTGTDQAFNFQVTSTGTGQANQPLATLTFHDGAWPAAPIFICHMTGGTGNYSDVGFTNGVATTTTLPMVYDAAPVAGSTYIFSCIGMGR